MSARRYGTVGFVIALFSLLSNSGAYATATGELDLSVRSWTDGMPLPGVNVTLSSNATQRHGVSTSDGSIVFGDLPIGNYTVSLLEAGASKAFDVAENLASVVSVDIGGSGPISVRWITQSPRRLHVAAGADPPIPAAPPPPPITFPRPLSTKPIHDSILGFYNDSHPVHIDTEPFFGRYSYVVLRDDDEAAEAKNLAFVRKLVEKYSPEHSRVGFFDQANTTDSPLSYNVFFFPVRTGTGAIDVLTHAGTAADILAAYDYVKARALRAAYCQIATHTGRTLCKPPFSDGPFLFTFFGPLPQRPTPANIPPAFAYDFTDVLPEQLDEPLGAVQVKIAVASNISTDQLLPPPMAAHVASTLEMLATALNAGKTGVQAWFDKQPDTTSAEH